MGRIVKRIIDFNAIGPEVAPVFVNSRIVHVTYDSGLDEINIFFDADSASVPVNRSFNLHLSDIEVNNELAFYVDTIFKGGIAYHLFQDRV